MAIHYKDKDPFPAFTDVFDMFDNRIHSFTTGAAKLTNVDYLKALGEITTAFNKHLEEDKEAEQMAQSLKGL